MKKINIIGLVILTVLLLSTGCVVIYDNPDSNPNPTPFPDSDNGFIRIVNQSDDWEIFYVYFRISGTNYWGDDMLDETETIKPFSSRIFAVPPGTYDVLIVDDSEFNSTAEYIPVKPDILVSLYFNGFSLEP